ncbi:MAG: hypothetical protein WBM35_16975 [Candidatus Electrothrix sp.]
MSLTTKKCQNDEKKYAGGHSWREAQKKAIIGKTYNRLDMHGAETRI